MSSSSSSSSSSRVTIDTNILHIRNIFAPNIPPNSAPAIGTDGSFKWKSPLEFISSMGAVSSLSEMYSGFSTLSSICDSNTKNVMRSTVAGLSASGYVSSSLVTNTVTTLSYTHSYINSSALYDCINNLDSLPSITNNVGPMVKFVRGAGHRFEDRAYVKTANPGLYRIYTSTLGLQGSNLANTSVLPNATITSGIIDIGGYRNKLCASSKMRIDVELGLQVTGGGGTISTFLYDAAASACVIGTPVVLDYTSLGKLGKITYFLTYEDLASRPTTLNIGHCCDSAAAVVTTNIPYAGGAHITLNNMD